MKKYHVTIEATIRKTIEVEAPDEDEARNQAHQLFTCMPEDGEYYAQDVLDWEEVEEEREPPEDRPSHSYMSASESAIDEQAALYNDSNDD